MDIKLKFTAVSGSRRQHGNTSFLVYKAMQSIKSYIKEFNDLATNQLHIESTLTTVESGFDNPGYVREEMLSANGLLLASPVYFGSISPSLNQAMQSCSNANLSSMVGASITVGTQRNGGQETAIEDIWRWYRAKNITIVGNGPVTSQYGGTAWGGALGAAEKDEYGIHTSEGAGKRLAQDVILRAIGVEITFSTCPSLIIKPLFPKFLFFYTAYRPNIDTLGFNDMLSLKEDMSNVEDCTACAVCPPGNDKRPGIYGCIFTDDVNKNYHRFYEADTIVICANDKNGLCEPDLWKVLNRMRSVRRNNYDLTGRCGSVIGNSLIPLKWLIRNNLPILPSDITLLYRETFYRAVGLSYLKSIGVNLFTEPTQHE